MLYYYAFSCIRVPKMLFFLILVSMYISLYHQKGCYPSSKDCSKSMFSQTAIETIVRFALLTRRLKNWYLQVFLISIFLTRVPTSYVMIFSQENRIGYVIYVIKLIIYIFAKMWTSKIKHQLSRLLKPHHFQNTLILGLQWTYGCLYKHVLLQLFQTNLVIIKHKFNNGIAS